MALARVLSFTYRGAARSRGPIRLARALPAALVVLGVFSACDSEEPEEPAPCAPGTAQIVVNECVLGITIDSDSADVVARLGPPSRYNPSSEIPSLRLYHYYDHPEVGDALVAMAPWGLLYVGTSEFSIRTPSGVGVGTSRSESRRLLGPPTSPLSEPNESGSDFYGSEADSVGTSFRFELTEGVMTLRTAFLFSFRQVFGPTTTPRSSPMRRL